MKEIDMLDYSKLVVGETKKIESKSLTSDRRGATGAQVAPQMPSEKC